MTHTLLRRPLGPRGVRVAVAGAVAVVRDGGSCVVREQGPELRREHDRVLRLRSETKRRRRRLRGVTPSAPTDRAPSPEISRRFFVRFRVAGGPRGVGTTCHPLSPEERSREPGDHAGTNDTDRCPMGRLDPARTGSRRPRLPGRDGSFGRLTRHARTSCSERSSTWSRQTPRPSVSWRHTASCGDDGTRTHDPLLAKQVL
jgi:hypothetical protein